MTTEKRSKICKKPAPRELPAIFLNEDFIPLGQPFIRIFYVPSTVALFKFLAGGELAVQNDAEKFKNTFVSFPFIVSRGKTIDIAEKVLRDEFSGIGVEMRVMECRKMPDNQLLVTMAGVRRVSFIDFVKRTPFRVARVDEVEEYGAENRSAMKLKNELISAVVKLSEAEIFNREFTQHCKSEEDLGRLADVLIYAIVQKWKDGRFTAEKLHELHSELNVIARMKAVYEKLDTTSKLVA